MPALPPIGVSIHAVTQRDHDVCPFDDAVAQVRRAGADHIALAVSDEFAHVVQPGHQPAGALLNLLDSDLAEIARRLADAHLACTLVHLGPVPLDNAKTRLIALGRFCRQAERAAELGCSLVALQAPCSAGHAAPSALKQTHIDVLVNLMEALAVRSGLRVCVGMRCGGPVETRDDADYFCNETMNPNVGLLLNVGHLSVLGEPGWEIIDRHLDRVFAVAWQDHPPRSPRATPVREIELGSGVSPLINYWLHLIGREPQPVHVVAVEDGSPADRPDALRRSIEHLHKVWRLEV